MYKLTKDSKFLISQAGEVFDNSKDPLVYVGQTSGEVLKQSQVEGNTEYFADLSDPTSFVQKGVEYWFITETGQVVSHVFTGAQNYGGPEDEATYVKALSDFGNLFQDQASADAELVARKLALQVKP